MMILIKEILPIMGIGIIFAGLYEMVLWLSIKLIEKEKRSCTEKKNKKVGKTKATLYSKKEKKIA